MQVKELTRFYEAIKEDSRISPTHIAVYMALFECWNQNDFQNPVLIKRRQVMEAAKISGLATYHRCIRELHDYGYIYYSPSFNSAKKSQVVIRMKEIAVASTIKEFEKHHKSSGYPECRANASKFWGCEKVRSFV